MDSQQVQALIERVTVTAKQARKKLDSLGARQIKKQDESLFDADLYTNLDALRIVSSLPLYLNHQKLVNELDKNLVTFETLQRDITECQQKLMKTTEKVEKFIAQDTTKKTEVEKKLLINLRKLRQHSLVNKIGVYGDLLVVVTNILKMKNGANPKKPWLLGRYAIKIPLIPNSYPSIVMVKNLSKRFSKYCHPCVNQEKVCWGGGEIEMAIQRYLETKQYYLVVDTIIQFLQAEHGSAPYINIIDWYKRASAVSPLIFERNYSYNITSGAHNVLLLRSSKCAYFLILQNDPIETVYRNARSAYKKLHGHYPATKERLWGTVQDTDKDYIIYHYPDSWKKYFVDEMNIPF